MSTTPRSLAVLLAAGLGALALASPAEAQDRVPTAQARTKPEGRGGAAPTPVDHPRVTGCGADQLLDNPDPHPAEACQAQGGKLPEPAPDRVPGCRTNDHFGAAIATGGDFDGDGRDDLAVGSAQRPEIAGVLSQAWVLAADGRVLLVIDGNGDTDRFGASLAFVPDMDGDGRDELLVGAPGHAGGGRAYLFTGRAHEAPGARIQAEAGAARVATGNHPDGRAGTAVLAADLDGDGVADLVVGAPGGEESDAAGFPGAVSVFSGASLHVGDDDGGDGVAGAAMVWTGPAPGSRFGASLALAGPRAKGAGRLLAVGAPATLGWGPDALKAPGAGAVLLLDVADAVPLRRIDGPAGSAFGFALAGGHDLDGDGRPDLAIGAPLWTSDGAAAPRGAKGPEGAVVVLSGVDEKPLLGSLADPSKALSRPGRFGAALAFVPDLTGDGRPELLAGAPMEMVPALPCTRHADFHPQGGPLAGAALLLDGHDGRVLFQLVGETLRDRLGWSVAAADLDGDGRCELLTGALGFSPPGGDPNATQLKETGRAYVVAGSRIERD